MKLKCSENDLVKRCRPKVNFPQVTLNFNEAWMLNCQEVIFIGFILSGNMTLQNWETTAQQEWMEHQEMTPQTESVETKMEQKLPDRAVGLRLSHESCVLQNSAITSAANITGT